jgi:predicted dehydrogenase/spore coat polysaccharide biosynthesis protein SpsF (cytidylyltransferase family)
MDTLNVLVIGLGSMGRKRIKILKMSTNIKNIYGFDIRQDRIDEVTKTYFIQCSNNIDEIIKEKNINIFIISTPPQYHHMYIKLALQLKIPFFVEAGVLDTDYIEISKLIQKKEIICKFSDTFMYHPAIIKIKELLEENTKKSNIGKISNIIYRSGQYLPDWHTYEKVSEFYVSKKESGGCREITPFELTWFTKLFGFPRSIVGTNKKTINIEGANNIDDTYNIILDYEDKTANIIIDVVSREATRNLSIIGDKGTIKWDWNDKFVSFFDGETKKTKNYDIDLGNTYDGYNKNITETMYINELLNFLIAVIDKNVSVSNTFEYDYEILKLLYAVEKSYKTKQFVSINATGILINVRLSSTRLPRKQLIKVLDKTYLEYLIERIKKYNENIRIIINTTYNDVDKELIDYARKLNVDIFFGDPNNIPVRQLQCSKYFGLTHIISVDGDDVLCSPQAINDIYEKFLSNPEINFIKTTGLPFGMNAFGYNVSVLEKQFNNINRKVFDTGWGEIFKTITMTNIVYDFISTEILDKIRMTLDYEIDSQFFEKVISFIKNITSISDKELINVILDNKFNEINIQVNEQYWEYYNRNKLIQNK